MNETERQLFLFFFKQGMAKAFDLQFYQEFVFILLYLRIPSIC